MLTNSIKSLAMSLIFTNIHLNIKYFHFFTLIVKFNLGVNIANVIFPMNWATSNYYHTKISNNFTKKWVQQREKFILLKQGVTFYITAIVYMLNFKLIYLWSISQTRNLMSYSFVLTILQCSYIMYANGFKLEISE